MTRERPAQSTRRSAATPPRAAKRRALGRLLFLVAAFIAFALSVSLWFGGYKSEGVFVGLWVPSILSLGTLYFASGVQA